MARNSLAGTKKGKSKSARYYQNNPKARAKKKAYDTKYQASPKRKGYKTALARANAKDPNSKVGDGKDMSHTKGGKLVKENQSSNRARQGAKKGKSKTAKRTGTKKR